MRETSTHLEIVVDENVHRLDVTVRDADGAKVVDSLDNLAKNVSREVF